MNEVFCFGLSITYFFILYKTNSATFRSISVIVYFCELLGLMVCGILTLASLTKSKCKSTTYGVFNYIAAFIMLGVSAFLLIVSFIIYFSFKSSGKLPDCLVKASDEEIEQVELRNLHNSMSAKENAKDK